MIINRCLVLFWPKDTTKESDQQARASVTGSNSATSSQSTTPQVVIAVVEAGDASTSMDHTLPPAVTPPPAVRLKAEPGAPPLPLPSGKHGRFRLPRVIEQVVDSEFPGQNWLYIDRQDLASRQAPCFYPTTLELEALRLLLNYRGTLLRRSDLALETKPVRSDCWRRSGSTPPCSFISICLGEYIFGACRV